MNDMSQEQNIPRPGIEQTPTTSNSIRTADKTVTSRLERLSSAIKKGVSKQLLLRASILSAALFPSDNIQDQNIHVPNILEPTPVSAPMPDLTQNYGLEKIQTPTVIKSTETPTKEPPSISTPTPEPTPLPSPTPTLEPIPTNTPFPTEALTPTMPPISTQEVNPIPSQPPQQEKAERKELIPYSPSITIVDAAPSVPTNGLIQKELAPTNEEMIKSMLGKNYISKEQIEQEFGPDYENKWDEIVNKYPQALTHRLVNLYFGHGEKVARTMENTLERSGLQSTGINILPLQETFDSNSIAFFKDASGNPGVFLNFDPKPIIELLKNDSSRVKSGSFQVGKVELFQKTKIDTEIIPKYDENDPQFSTTGMQDQYGMFYPGAVTGKVKEDGKIVWVDTEGKEVKSSSMSMDDYVEEVKKRRLENSESIAHRSTELIIEGAYTKAKAMENLPKMFEICNAYPNKFFVFALGNNGEDIREAMSVLKDKVPNNLLIVGQWIKYDYGFGVYEGPSMEYGKYGQTLGADIYVYNQGSGNPYGSSFSAPEIAIEIELLLKKGLSFDQAKAKILASSDSHPKTLADGTEVVLKVFNPQLLKTK